MINLILSLENIILTTNKTKKNNDSMQKMNDCQYYKLELKGETKNNKTFIRNSRKKIKKKIIIISIKS